MHCKCAVHDNTRRSRDHGALSWLDLPVDFSLFTMVASAHRRQSVRFLNPYAVLTIYPRRRMGRETTDQLTYRRMAHDTMAQTIWSPSVGLSSKGLFQCSSRPNSCA